MMTLYRVFAFIVSLAPALSFLPLARTESSRQGTMFGLRVAPEFSGSIEAGRIQRSFQSRVWLWSLVVGVISVSAVGAYTGITFFVAPVISMAGGAVAFALARRKVYLKTPLASAPVIREAVLFGGEKHSVWFTCLEWLTLVLPPVPPLIAIVFICTHWTSFPPELVIHWRGIMPVGGHVPPQPLHYLARAVLALGFAAVSSLLQCALLFGARSADWDTDPDRSLTFRFVLGILFWPIFFGAVLELTSVALYPFREGLPVVGNALSWMASSRSTLWIGMLVCFPPLFLSSWLKRRLATHAGDPMSDSCWKGGMFYFNYDDPAMVVPTRQGVGYSPNYARRFVWLATGTIITTMILAWSQSGLF